MKLTDFIAAMDNLAPRELALGFDNVGLLIGTERRDIKKGARCARLHNRCRRRGGKQGL